MAIERLGTVQRRIWRAFIAEPSAELSTAELLEVAFPRLEASDLKRSHWYSVRRAAERVAIRGGRRRPGGLVWKAKAEGSSALNGTYPK